MEVKIKTNRCGNQLSWGELKFGIYKSPVQNIHIIHLRIYVFKVFKIF